MKKQTLLLSALALASFGLASCNPQTVDSSVSSSGSSSSSASSHSSSSSSSASSSSSSTEAPVGSFILYFETNGGSPIENQVVLAGKKAVKPTDPTKEGFLFEGWYTEATFVTLFDWDAPIESDWHLFAKWGEKTEPKNPGTLYFRDASWWNVSGAHVGVKLNGEGGDYGTLMDFVRFCPDTYKTVGYNYWKVEVEDLDSLESVQFFRLGDSVGTYWGASTDVLSFSVAAGKNLYDIKDSTAVWTNAEEGAGFVAGVWGTYDPNDLGNPDAPEKITDGTFLVGSLNDWAESEKYLFKAENEELTLLNVTLTEGDLFKVKRIAEGEDPVWLGYDAIEEASLASLKGALAKDEKDGNIQVVTSGTYDLYVTASNALRISRQVEAPDYAFSLNGETKELIQDGSNWNIGPLDLSVGDLFYVEGKDGARYGYKALADTSSTFVEAGAEDAVKVLAEGTFSVSFSSETKKITLTFKAAEKETTLYLADAPWWNADNAWAAVSIDGGDAQALEPIRFVRNGLTTIYNYYSFTVKESAKTLSFSRISGDGKASDWGAKTVTISLSERGENNLYDLRNTEATWDGTLAGTWGVYDPEDKGPSIDCPVYLVGSGSFVPEGQNAWTKEGGVQFTVNRDTRSETMLLNQKLEKGDTFKILSYFNNESGSWNGQSALKANCPAASLFEADNDGNFVLKEAATLSFYFSLTENPGLWIAEVNNQ